MSVTVRYIITRLAKTYREVLWVAFITSCRDSSKTSPWIERELKRQESFSAYGDNDFQIVPNVRHHNFIILEMSKQQQQYIFFPFRFSSKVPSAGKILCLLTSAAEHKHEVYQIYKWAEWKYVCNNIQHLKRIFICAFHVSLVIFIKNNFLKTQCILKLLKLWAPPSLICLRNYLVRIRSVILLG